MATTGFDITRWVDEQIAENPLVLLDIEDLEERGCGYVAVDAREATAEHIRERVAEWRRRWGLERKAVDYESPEQLMLLALRIAAQRQEKRVTNQEANRLFDRLFGRRANFRQLGEMMRSVYGEDATPRRATRSQASRPAVRGKIFADHVLELIQTPDASEYSAHRAAVVACAAVGAPPPRKSRAYFRKIGVELDGATPPKRPPLRIVARWPIDEPLDVNEVRSVGRAGMTLRMVEGDR